MYKVFMNDKPILLTDSYDVGENFVCLNFTAISFDALRNLIFSDSCKGIQLLCLDLNKDWESFQANFKVIAAAGGKVYNESKEILFIYRLGKWDLPKGHVEKGESIEEAALREVQEECGIDALKIQHPLETTYHVFDFKGEVRLKVTYWFEMTTDSTAILVPQEEEGITVVDFKNPKEVKQALSNTYENIKLLF